MLELSIILGACLIAGAIYYAGCTISRRIHELACTQNELRDQLQWLTQTVHAGASTVRGWR